MTQQLSEADSAAIVQDTMARLNAAAFEHALGGQPDPARYFPEVGEEPVFMELVLRVIDELAQEAAANGLTEEQATALAGPLYGGLMVVGSVGHAIGGTVAFSALGVGTSEPDWDRLLDDGDTPDNPDPESH